MSGSLMIVLIVVVWLFVLAPLVFGKSSKPIRRSGEAYEETRVLHQGGTAPVQPRRRPKLTRADVRYDEDDTRDLEIVGVSDEPAEPATVIDETVSQDEDLVDGEVIADDNFDETEAESDTDSDTGESDNLESDTEEPENSETYETYETYETREFYLTPEDFGYQLPGSTVISLVEDHNDEAEEDPAEPEETAEREDTAELEDAAEDELTEEELAFAQARRGRGGWDPVADQTNRVTRYQRRQRTFIGLCVALIVGVIFGLIVGGWAWAAPVVVAGLIAWYLVALRTLVRQEQELRTRRIRQLRRARLGVRSSDKDAPIPPELRRPGAIIVEMDDNSPDFDHLPVTYTHHALDDDTSAPAPPTPGQRVS